MRDETLPYLGSPPAPLPTLQLSLFQGSVTQVGGYDDDMYMCSACKEDREHVESGRNVGGERKNQLN